MELDWILDAEKWSASAAILVCCLSCYRREPDDLSSPGDPHALIAPFARRDFYRTAVRGLRNVVRTLEETHGIPRHSTRIFCNSRILEKPLLAASGISSRGRNSLAIVPGLGSLFIIAGAILPVPSASLAPAARAPSSESASRTRRADPCGACRRCMDACPVGAIAEPGLLDPELCLQGLADSVGFLDPPLMEKWGARLYGCQECQAVCPHNAELAEETPTSLGELGPSVSLRRLLSLDAAAAREFFRGTPMGMSRVPVNALFRNALIAAGNRGDSSVRDEVERFAGSGSRPLRETARWALERLAHGRRQVDLSAFRP